MTIVDEKNEERRIGMRRRGEEVWRGRSGRRNKRMEECKEDDGEQGPKWGERFLFLARGSGWNQNQTQPHNINLTGRSFGRLFNFWILHPEIAYHIASSARLCSFDRSTPRTFCWHHAPPVTPEETLELPGFPDVFLFHGFSAYTLFILVSLSNGESHPE
ncbi:hypothetical protein BJX63DRAFT_366665 [Aspergillus granulosus]|uniref:Uncharacterized protein n=1 Tax=Aspergillus granulosus TaxID=176169 RepID=A0ABR4H1K3_9EURO